MNKVRIGIIEINTQDFVEQFWKLLEKVTNTSSHTIRFNWWAYRNEKMLEEKYKLTLNPKMFDESLKVLSNQVDEFKQVYKKLMGVLPHD